jgi:hypothetical protein
MVQAVRGYVDRHYGGMNARIDDIDRRVRSMPASKSADADTIARLEARIADLEARPTMQYRGTWEAGKQYVPGDFCTHGGSVWHCNSATLDRPGATPTSWTLAVKRGADAR